MTGRYRLAGGSVFSRLPRLCWVILCATFAGAVWAASWVPLAKDGIHDPAAQIIGVLQEPREALAVLPVDTAGNQVRWVQALELGHIKPRTHVGTIIDMQVRDTDVILKNTGEMPMVKFPHRQHTAWLDCGSCHDELFSRVPGATKISMAMILRGEKCGLCHGAVAFPLTECERCHNVARQVGPRMVDERK